ncbi:hypothetical protein ACFPRL_17090 [Pseudoclavibacter helvolus]
MEARNGWCPASACVSEPQMPISVLRTSAWPGAGVGISRRSRVTPKRGSTTAPSMLVEALASWLTVVVNSVVMVVLLGSGEWDARRDYASRRD